MKKPELTGICLLSCVPMRSRPSDKSEMVSQMLFGETFSVVRSRKDWIYVTTHADSYSGWVQPKIISLIHEPLASDKNDSCVVPIPVALFATEENDRLFLPGGSLLSIKTFSESLVVGGKTYFPVHSIDHPGDITNTAKQYLGAPYLWGGKTIFGIDCSGLVQVVFRTLGHWLPRDAALQEAVGKDIPFISAQPGDVAFFRNREGKVIHTGILCEHGIIHASGRVRLDRFDEHGIYNEAEKCYTHVLHSVKRMF